jgi:hypothetical protein
MHKKYLSGVVVYSSHPTDNAILCSRGILINYPLNFNFKYLPINIAVGYKTCSSVLACNLSFSANCTSSVLFSIFLP